MQLDSDKTYTVEEVVDYANIVLNQYKERVRDEALRVQKTTRWCDEGVEESFRRLDLKPLYPTRSGIVKMAVTLHTPDWMSVQQADQQAERFARPGMLKRSLNPRVREKEPILDPKSLVIEGPVTRRIVTVKSVYSGDEQVDQTETETEELTYYVTVRVNNQRVARKGERVTEERINQGLAAPLATAVSYMCNSQTAFYCNSELVSVTDITE